MDNRKIITAVSITVLLLISGALILNSINEDQSTGDVERSLSDNSSSFNGSETVRTTSEGVKYTVHPDELVQGCPGLDCIPSIDDPKYEGGSSADWLDGSEGVIGLEINNESRAYPLKILSRHEIVNGRVGGEPVAVTYCPLCRSGVTYSRDLDGEVLEFGVSGKLHQANLVMYDRGSETYWNQISGKAIVGEKVPAELDLIFSSITTWEKWKQGHPDTKVLSRDTGIYPVGTYDTETYQGYKNSERVGFGVDEVDERLPAKELVYGLKVENQSKAYKNKTIEQKQLIQDKIGNKTVLVFERPDDDTVTALIKEDEGFKYSLNSENLKDSNGNTYTFNGEQINGETSMREVVPQGFYWFAWSKFNPNTQIYNNQG